MYPCTRKSQTSRIEVFSEWRVPGMQIAPAQSINIFGWWDQPRLILTWDDVTAKNLRWPQLRLMHFTVEQLMRIQPDKKKWIQRGAVGLKDVKDTMAFPINPISDLQADLGEVWSLRLSPEEMKQMGLTFDQFLSRGLTVEIMAHFNMSLSAWILIGLNSSHIVSAQMSQHVFGMEQSELKSIIDDFTQSEI